MLILVFYETNIPRLSDNLHTLIMCNINYLKFPPKWPSNLKSLDISGSELENLENIMELPEKLEELILQRTSITSFTSNQLYRFKNLKKLDISGNEFEELPEFLPETLEDLDISRNNIKFIGKLSKSLKKLNISDNQMLNEITQWPSNLTTLNILNIPNIEFPKLPSTLKELRTSYMYTLSENIINLSNLYTLYLIEVKLNGLLNRLYII